MKTLVNIVCLLLITSTCSMAQQRRPMERIHAAKVAYIIDRLHLTAEQSGNFIPIFNDYEREIWETRQAFMKKYKGAEQGDADDATFRRYIDDNLDYQQQVIDIKRKYNERFLKILSPQQLAELSKAEREFKQILMKQLEKQRGGRFRRGGGGY